MFWSHSSVTSHLPSPFPHQSVLPFSLVYGSWGNEAFSPLAQHRTYRRWIITLTTVTMLCSWKCSDSPSAEGPSPTNAHSPRTLSRPRSRDLMVTPPGVPTAGLALPSLPDSLTFLNHRTPSGVLCEPVPSPAFLLPATPHPLHAPALLPHLSSHHSQGQSGNSCPPRGKNQRRYTLKGLGGF